MDNIETTSEPVGVEGATSAPGNSADDTQTTEGSEETSQGVSDVQEAPEEPEVGQASNPWDNDPKFKGKTAGDIYKAQQEAEKLIGRLGQEAKVARVIKEKYGVSPEQLLANIEAQELEQRRQQYANNPLAPIVDEVQQLKQTVARQEQEKALASQEKELDSFLKNNPDYSASRDKILKLALTPGIGFNPDTGEETSFEDLAREWVGEVRAQGQQDAYRKIETKKMTQATGVSAGDPKTKLSAEDMKNLSTAEMESFLPHAPRL